MIIDERNSRGDVVRFEKHILTSDSKLLNLADNINHGVLTDVAATTNQKGEENSAQYFGLATSVVTIPTYTALNVGANCSGIVSIYPVTLLNIFSLLAKYNATGDQRSFVFCRVLDELQLFVYADGGATNLKRYKANTKLVINTWARVGFSFNAGTIKLYLNGVETAVTAITDLTVNSIYNSTADFQIGLSSLGSQQAISGKIADEIFKNVTLTPEEFYDDYLEYLG